MACYRNTCVITCFLSFVAQQIENGGFPYIGISYEENFLIFFFFLHLLRNERAKGTFLHFFYDNKSCFFFAKGNSAFFVTKFDVKRPFERCLIKDSKTSFGQKSHFNYFAGHFEVFIFVAHNFPQFFFREAAKFIGNVSFQSYNLNCKYMLFKLNLNKRFT